MKRIFLYSVFAASIAFNIFFIVGMTRPLPIAGNRPGFERTPRFKNFFSEHREKMEKYHRETFEAKEDFLQYLKSEDYNKETAREKIDKIITSQHELERVMGERLIEFRSKYGAEEFRNMFKRRRPRNMNHRKLGGRQ